VYSYDTIHFALVLGSGCQVHSDDSEVARIEAWEHGNAQSSWCIGSFFPLEINGRMPSQLSLIHRSHTRYIQKNTHQVQLVYKKEASSQLHSLPYLRAH